MFVKLGSPSSDLLGGVICTILAVVLILIVILILILLTILLFIICRQRKLKCETGQMAHSLSRLHISHLEVNNKMMFFDLAPWWESGVPSRVTYVAIM